MTMSDVCYCNPRTGTDGSFHHAINCPLAMRMHSISIGASLKDERSEWQKGYDDGYAAGLAAAREKKGSLW